MAEYRLTKRADKDLLAIYLYTVERFGQDQAERYTHDIKECFELLASNPHMRRVAVVHRRMRPPEPEAPEFWFSEGRTGRRRSPRDPE
jgi:plasmid stabilization system protein ParE